jgi:hypothetical protein
LNAALLASDQGGRTKRGSTSVHASGALPDTPPLGQLSSPRMMAVLRLDLCSSVTCINFFEANRPYCVVN